jgi:hypothetical protein
MHSLLIVCIVPVLGASNEVPVVVQEPTTVAKLEQKANIGDNLPVNALSQQRKLQEEQTCE